VFKSCTCAYRHDSLRAERFVIRLIATHSEIDSVKFKDASLVVTLVVTYSDTDREKFKDASL